MSIYMVTISNDWENDSLVEGEVHRYDSDGELIDERLTSLETPARNGGSGYQGPDGKIWGTHFDAQAAASFDPETLLHISSFGTSYEQPESILVGSNGMLYVGYQQRNFNMVGVEDSLWRPMSVFDDDGTLIDTVGLNQWGHQMTDWLEPNNVIIYTDEKRLIRTLDITTGDESIFADVYGTEPGGYRFHNQFPDGEGGVEDQTYEENPGSWDTWGIQVDRSAGRVYVLCYGRELDIFNDNAWISIWDTSGSHLGNYLIEDDDFFPYRMVLHAGELWVPREGVDTYDSATFETVSYGSAGSLTGNLIYKVGIDGSGTDTPFMVFAPENEWNLGAIVAATPAFLSLGSSRRTIMWART